MDSKNQWWEKQFCLWLESERLELQELLMGRVAASLGKELEQAVDDASEPQEQPFRAETGHCPKDGFEPEKSLVEPLIAFPFKTLEDFLVIPKASLIERIVKYKMLQMVTLGLLLWGRTIGFKQVGVSKNLNAITNPQFLATRLEKWNKNDLADICYQIEVTTCVDYSTIEEVDRFLEDIMYNLSAKKASRLTLDEEYRKELCKRLKKLLDNQEALAVLLCLVKDK